MAKAATMRLEQVAISRLRPAPYNPRRELTADERRSLVKSLTEFGAVDPAVINEDNTIIGGHQRVQVAREIGWSKFPCMRVSVSKVDEKRLNLALNKISGGFDEEKLLAVLEELVENAAIDLEASGFVQAEIDEILSRSLVGLVPEDEVPEPPSKPASRPGDVWLLGRHRLMCGDATRAADVSRLLAGASPRLMVTDPPYGVSYDPSWRAREAAKGNCEERRRHGACPMWTRPGGGP